MMNALTILPLHYNGCMFSISHSHNQNSYCSLLEQNFNNLCFYYRIKHHAPVILASHVMIVSLYMYKIQKILHIIVTTLLPLYIIQEITVFTRDYVTLVELYEDVCSFKTSLACHQEICVTKPENLEFFACQTKFHATTFGKCSMVSLPLA